MDDIKHKERMKFLYNWLIDIYEITGMKVPEDVLNEKRKFEEGSDD